MLDTLEAIELRRIGFDDVPWVLSLAFRKYRAFDPGLTLTWLIGMIRAPSALALRSDHAFLIVNVTTSAWWPDERECHVLFACAASGHHWELVRLLRQSISWSRGKGCVRWWFSSETDIDIEVLALRVGAQPRVMRYCIDLTYNDQTD
jgi:hypothetical protein